MEYLRFTDLQEVTIDSYRRILYNYSDYMKKKGITSPKRTDILNYKEYLKKRVKSASIQKNIIVIRNFYKWYHIQGYGPNIAEGIKGARIEATFKREALSIEQSKKLLAKAKHLATKNICGKRNYAIVSLIITTGLRTIEIERSDVSDISKVGDLNVLYIQGKGHHDKDNYVKLSNEVYEIIMNYLKERNDDHEPLFINHSNNNKGTRLQTKTVSIVIKDLLRRIGIDSKNYTAHSLRHTVATTALMNGATLQQTQQLLRHSSIETTTIYAHNISRAENNLELEVSDLMFGNPNKKKKK